MRLVMEVLVAGTAVGYFVAGAFLREDKEYAVMDEEHKFGPVVADKWTDKFALH